MYFLNTYDRNVDGAVALNDILDLLELSFVVLILTKRVCGIVLETE